MTIPVTTDLNTERFVLMLKDLQKISGKSFKEVLLSQTKSILKFCIHHTKVANAGKIRERLTRQSSKRWEFPSGEVISESRRHPGHISFLDTSTWKGKGGPVFLVGGKSWHDMTNFKWSDERWAKYQAFLGQTETMEPVSRGKSSDVKKALRSRGLAKHSWYQIAEKIGIAADLGVSGYIAKARPQNGLTYENGTAEFALGEALAYIKMRNSYPAAIRMNGQNLINYAIISRANAFEREVEKGVFQDLTTRAQRYPGLFVKP